MKTKRHTSESRMGVMALEQRLTLKSDATVQAIAMVKLNTLGPKSPLVVEQSSTLATNNIRLVEGATRLRSSARREDSQEESP